MTKQAILDCELVTQSFYVPLMTATRSQVRLDSGPHLDQNEGHWLFG